MSDDPTKKLPKNQGRYDTQPTIETVLERINEMGESLSGKIDKVRNDLSAEIETVRVELRGEIQSVRSELSGEIQTVRSEMNQQFTLLNKKVDILASEVLEVRAEHEVFEDRLGKVERKTS